MNLKIKTEVAIEVITCAACGVQFGLTERYIESRREDHKIFYCPNQHDNYFPQKTEAEKLREELKRKEQELADKAIEKIAMENKLTAQVNEANRKLKRVHNGVCPCCNRSFQNLQRHMKTKHPELLNKV
jgi:hypothetical protein